jgi:hypothetical protein
MIAGGTSKCYQVARVQSLYKKQQEKAAAAESATVADFAEHFLNDIQFQTLCKEFKPLACIVTGYCQGVVP